MAEWTQDAYEYLDGYLTQVSALAKRQGDDAEEIVSGLRDHIAQECESRSGDMVGIDELLAALAVIGSPEEVVSLDTPLKGASPPPSASMAAMRSVPPPQMPPQAQVPSPVIVKKRSGLSCALTALVVVIGFLLIPVLSVLAAIFLPSFSRAQEAIGGHIHQVIGYLSEGMDINTQDQYGNTVLHYAALHGHMGMTIELLAREADANILNTNGLTALDYALYGQHDVTANTLRAHTKVNVEQH